MGTATKAPAARTRLRAARSVGAMLLVLVALTGCVQVRHQSSIEADLSGTTTMRIAISRDTIGAIGALGEAFGGMNMGMPETTIATGEDFARSIEEDVRKLGGTVAPFESDRYIGADVLLPFRSLDEMTTQINTLLGTDPAKAMEDPLPGANAEDDTIIILRATSTGDRVRIEGSIDPLSALGGPDGIASFSPELAAQISGDPDAVIALSFTLPGAVLDADGAATRTGSTVSWSWPIGSPVTTFFAESDRSGRR